MDHNRAFFDDFSIPNEEDDVLLESEITGWQPFSTPSKFQMQKQFPNSLVPQTSSMYYNENGSQSCSGEQNQVLRRYTPFSDKKKVEVPENIINTDFLSAIPHARQSKTVKRKLTYNGVGVTKANENVEKPKTYFPFEFIGRATRKSVLQESILTPKENEKELNPTMITGHAFRKQDINGSIYETAKLTPLCETLPPRKRAKKFSSKKKSNSTVALEQHFEQIRRKHAEFNWEIPESHNTQKNQNEVLLSTDVDTQCVPSTPFLEQYTSPSLYSFNEAPAQPSISFMPTVPAPSFGLQNFERRRTQGFATDVYTNDQPWPNSILPTREFPGNLLSDVTNEDHLYPY